MHHYQNDLNKLGKASIADLCHFKGIGEAKAITIIAALEIGRRRDEQEAAPPELLQSSRDGYNLMKRQMVDLTHEEFWIILIGRSHKIITQEMVSRGGFSQTLVDPKVIFRTALQHQASGIVLVHNHPSGSLKPSEHDITLTSRTVEAGKLLNIQILDHLIITDQGYYSFADEGVLMR